MKIEQKVEIRNTNGIVNLRNLGLYSILTL